MVPILYQSLRSLNKFASVALIIYNLDLSIKDGLSSDQVQSQIEIEHYYVAYFKHFTKFDAL